MPSKKHQDKASSKQGILPPETLVSPMKQVKLSSFVGP
jgi:hypothetical protein